jgi:hypothetical protein
MRPAPDNPQSASRWLRGRFFYLFLCQISFLVLFPYFDLPGPRMIFFRLLGVAAFVAGVYAVSDKRAQWVTALILAIPAGVLNTMFALRPDAGLVVPTLISTILFLAFTAVSLLRAVLRSTTVTHDTIYGALSVYFLFAITWGVGYFLLTNLQPGAISLDPARHPNHRMDWSDCIFYSYVTLTTIGYGDMVPITPQARSLSILEAVSGTMYVAVLIARLVGLNAAAKPKADSAPATPIAAASPLPLENSDSQRP